MLDNDGVLVEKVERDLEGDVEGRKFLEKGTGHPLGANSLKYLTRDFKSWQVAQRARCL
jgi:hypothetical protein